MIDRRAVEEYLLFIGKKELPLKLFEVIDMKDEFPVERIQKLLNEKGQRQSLSGKELLWIKKLKDTVWCVKNSVFYNAKCFFLIGLWAQEN